MISFVGSTTCTRLSSTSLVSSVFSVYRVNGLSKSCQKPGDFFIFTFRSPYIWHPEWWGPSWTSNRQILSSAISHLVEMETNILLQPCNVRSHYSAIRSAEGETSERELIDKIIFILTVHGFNNYIYFSIHHSGTGTRIVRAILLILSDYYRKVVIYVYWQLYFKHNGHSRMLNATSNNVGFTRLYVG